MSPDAHPQELVRGHQRPDRHAHLPVCGPVHRPQDGWRGGWSRQWQQWRPLRHGKNQKQFVTARTEAALS